MFTPHQMSQVTCHMSRDWCHVSGVMHKKKILTKCSSQSVKGLLSTGPAPSSSRMSQQKRKKCNCFSFQPLNFRHKGVLLIVYDDSFQSKNNLKCREGGNLFQIFFANIQDGFKIIQKKVTHFFFNVLKISTGLLKEDYLV